MKKEINFATIRLGVNRIWKKEKSKVYFSLPVGLQLNLPVSGRYTTSGSQVNESSNKITWEENYIYDVFYGLYLQPMLNIKFSKTNRVPWSMGVYLDANASINLKYSKQNTILLGAGIQLRYQFE